MFRLEIYGHGRSKINLAGMYLLDVTVDILHIAGGNIVNIVNIVIKYCLNNSARFVVREHI